MSSFIVLVDLNEAFIDLVFLGLNKSPLKLVNVVVIVTMKCKYTYF